MILLSLLIALACNPGATLLVASPPVARVLSGAQDLEDEKQLLEDFKDAVKERGAADDEAIGLLDRLVALYPQSDTKVRQAVVKAFAAAMKAKRKELDDGAPDDRLAYQVAVALGSMGPESVKALDGAIGKVRKDETRVQVQLVISLGKTADESGVRTLTGLLDHHDSTMQAAAADGLGYFRHADLELRKKIFQELLKTVMGQKAKKDIDPNDIEAHERYDAIAGPILSSMQRLTGESLQDPDEWQRWWNKNKKRDWDEKQGG